MSALSYFEAYTTAIMPVNLIQAQRDYFGAHTYQRTDMEGTFHTEWDVNVKREASVVNAWRDQSVAKALTPHALRFNNQLIINYHQSCKIIKDRQLRCCLFLVAAAI